MINSREYWEERFSTGDWDAYGGQEQTRFFYNLALESLPQWLISDIQENDLSIVDVGCAEGAGTELFKKKFSRSRVIGIDFSESAIKQARERYVQCEFECLDVNNIQEKFDVVLSSNVLEHLKDPYVQLSRLVGVADKYCIIILPFQEDNLHKEHFTRFDYDSFMIKVENGYLVYHKEIDTSKVENTMWPGKQIVLVYVKENYLSQQKVKLSRMNNGDFERQCEMVEELEIVKQNLINKENEIEQQQEKISAYINTIEQNKIDLEKVNGLLESKQCEIVEYQKQIEESKKEVEKSKKEVEESKKEIEESKKEIKNKEIEIQKLVLSQTDYQDSIEQLKSTVIQLEAEITKVINSQQELEVKVLDYQNGVYEAKNIGIDLANTKMFKLVHLLYRIKHQLIKGSINDKKLFFKWLYNRRNKRAAIQDHSLNPIFQIINRLEMLNTQTIISDTNIRSKSFEYKVKFDNTTEDFKKYWNQSKQVVIQELSTIQEQRVQNLKKIINKKKYKGIVVYPHIVNWEPLQTPQQLMRGFAQKGYLCIFCENSNENRCEVEIEPNIILTQDEIMLNAVKEVEVIVLCTWIPTLPIIEAIPNKVIWYHILDQIDIFSGYCKEYERLHMELSNNADIVTYVAHKLSECVMDAKKAFYLPNGCNTQDFVDNIHEGNIPNEMQTILKMNKKIIGYYGYIAKWFDMKTLYELACRNEDWVFVLIGDCIAEFNDYAHERIVFLGRKAYSELADYAKCFDVACIPFEISEMMDCVSPIKFFEYCALGLPVVTSYMKEMEQYQAEAVYLAHNIDEFEFYINRALTEEVKQYAKLNSIKIAESNTWEKRIIDMEFLLSKNTNYEISRTLTEMYNRMDILFLSVIDYNFRYQRPQHLANAFAKQGHRVFYINANFNQQQTQTVETIGDIKVVSVKSDEYSAVHIADYTKNAIEIENELENIIIQNGIRDCLIVVEYPTWVQGATYLKDKYGFKIITDYLDDYTGFEDTNISCLASCCYKLLENSDRVIASSSYLSEVAAKYNTDVEIVRNGTEYECFNKAYDPDNNKVKDRKVVGYYGAIAHWFDFEKVTYLATKLPDVDFVLIGEVSENKELLSKYSNIKLLGEKPYASLPMYLKEFDVCLIPFDTSTDLIKATNPVKFYEYLSAAKKVVATEIPELMPFKDKYVYLSNDNEEFLEYVKLCLDNKDTLASEKECLEFAKENDWTIRGENFIQYAVDIYPKVSIIVLTYNQLAYTKECLQSIIEKTAYPNYEIIIVDNKSTDETPKYLMELEKQYAQIKVILNDENLGFAAGNNVGIKASSGEYIILLNNDTVVTRGWITGLIKHFEQDNQLGILGPVTNSICNESKINISYDNISDMDYFAYQYTNEHMNTTYDKIDVLAMFCIMISRTAFNKIGYLEQIYGVGMFEDDDYSYKAKSLGYKVKCAEDVFVHHYGNVSFKKLEDKQYMELFNRNKKIFEERWNVKWEQHKYRPGVK